MSLGLLILTLATPRTAAATSIVINGDFEAGTTSGWTTTPATSGSLFGVSTSDPHSGNYAAFFGGVDVGFGNKDRISQVIQTIPGQFYIFSFWLENEIPICSPVNCFANDFNYYWDDPAVGLGHPGTFLVSELPFAYRQFSFLVQATGALTTIGFAGANEPGFYHLDDVSVVATPEPTSLLLLGSGLLVMAWVGRRYRRASSFGS